MIKKGGLTVQFRTSYVCLKWKIKPIWLMIKSVILLYVYLGTIVINPPSFILIIHPLILSIYQVMIVVSREMLLRCISKSLLCQSRESLQFLHWRSVSWLVDCWSGDTEVFPDWLTGGQVTQDEVRQDWIVSQWCPVRLMVQFPVHIIISLSQSEDQVMKSAPQ